MLLPIRRPTKKQKTLIPSSPQATAALPVAVRSTATDEISTSPLFASSTTSPPRSWRSKNATSTLSSRLVTPLKDLNSSRTKPSVWNPCVDLIHHRFDCQADHNIIDNETTFHRISFAEALRLRTQSEQQVQHNKSSVVQDTNARHCPNCLCYICDAPVENCKEWDDFHCHAHDQDSQWRSLKQQQQDQSAIPQEETPALLQNKTVKSLKAILRRNRQHTSGGNKQALLARIQDRETYGPLAPCPQCPHGRLKLSDDTSHGRQDMANTVVCHGYFEGDAYKPCNFACLASEAPRWGDWNFACYDDEHGGQASKARRNRLVSRGPNEETSSWTVPQLKRILQRNLQHVTGSKKTLLLRLADGRRYGRLGHCPLCKRGRLKVHQVEEEENIVICPGFYDVAHHRTVPCAYSSPPEEAPRIGPWIEETKGGDNYQGIQLWFWDTVTTFTL
eukprot:scaffold12116_cov125-Cylindrotheca_fusiformis.AAC.6